MDNYLSTAVQMQYLRPGQLEAALRKFPVVYVPFGLIEWHGRHLPLGTDALKAHGFLVKCAEQFGGIVYPPIYFPWVEWLEVGAEMHPDEPEWKTTMLTALFNRLKATGVRVIIGVSGHNIHQQITWINQALQPVIADGTITGIGLWEMTLSEGEESNSDHAAKWETSDMQFFYPECVDLTELGTAPLDQKKHPTEGIMGEDPRTTASAQIGRRNVELATAALGRKAQELLESLPIDQRAFNLPTLAPPHWWMV